MVDDTKVSIIGNASSEKKEKWICSICKTVFNLEYEFFDTRDVIDHDRMVHPRGVANLEVIQ